MADNFEELLDEYAIEYITTGKNTSKNYININCVGVGDCSFDTNFTFGIHRSGNRGFCWWCSTFYTPYRMAKGLGIPWDEWKATMNNVADDWGVQKEELEIIDPDEIESIEIPGDALHQVHKNYLISRGFDPDWLVQHYNIKGTLKYTQDYKLSYRVIFPITYEDKVISYIGRSYLEEQMNKYICCNPENESAFHKHLLFNLDKARSNRVILVEGALDALKLIQSSGNFNILATYGTSIKAPQLQLLRLYYDEVVVLFDPESAAQQVADSIVNYLQSFGKKAVSLKLKTGDDPGALSKEDAKFLVNHVLSEEFKF